jgi:hypothetical protein
MTNCRSPQTGHARGARYAVCGKLDSLNDIRIFAENEHYSGAFGPFDTFAMIFGGEMMAKPDRFQAY